MANVPSSDPKASRAPHEGAPRLRGWVLTSILGSLMLTLFLAALDQTIVGTSLPTIIGDLQGFDRFTWVITAYLLTSTTMIPFVGKLSDQFGRRGIMLASVTVFLIGSALSGASQSMNQLIAFRGLQGLGAGALVALVFILVGDIFPPAERARWQGLFSAVWGLASIVGPLGGGWITDHASWRWIFYVNLPLGAFALAALVAWLPGDLSVRTSRESGWAALSRIDVAGTLTSGAATVCLLLGLSWGGQTASWSSPKVVSMLVSAGVLYVVFVMVERLAAEPILPLDMLRDQVFAADAVLSLTVYMAFVPLVVYLPLFVQGVLGRGATNSGAVLVPLSIAMSVGAAVTGQLIARFGRYQWLTILGATVVTYSMFLMARMTAETGLLTVTRNMIVAGIGFGLLIPVLTLAVQNAVPRNRLGVGTAAISYLRSMGAALGVAIIGSVVNNTIASELVGRLPEAARQLPPAALSAATNPEVLVNSAFRQEIVARGVAAATQRVLPQALAQATANLPPGPQHDGVVATITSQVTSEVATQVTHLLTQIFDATRQALAVGIQNGFVTSIVISGTIFIITLFLKDIPLRRFQDIPPSSSDLVSRHHFRALDAESKSPASRWGR